VTNLCPKESRLTTYTGLSCMIANDASSRLGLWGAALSTGLAVIKVLEFRANRGRLQLDLIWQPGDAGRDGRVHHSWSAPIAALRVTNKDSEKSAC
jgi:hypothetical protein